MLAWQVGIARAFPVTERVDPDNPGRPLRGNTPEAVAVGDLTMSSFTAKVVKGVYHLVLNRL
jgi:hypothetical protein